MVGESAFGVEPVFHICFVSGGCSQMAKKRNRSPFELVVYYGEGGIWQRVYPVWSVGEADKMLDAKFSFHSAELYPRGSDDVVKRWGK